MIRVVMFDLGLTLVDTSNHPFAHVHDALTAITGFKTSEGKPLRSCLVSDFTMAAPPVTSAKVTALFNQYLAILDSTGLRPFFEPVEKRVTLSTHAGVMKPDRKVFEKAVRRLGIPVPLEDCLFITENADHIDKTRNQFHMQALQFRAPGANQFDFEDWAQAPALIAHLVAPHLFANTRAALKVHLAARGIELVSAELVRPPDTIQVSGQAWHPISVAGFDDLHNLRISIPVEGQITRGAKGEFQLASVMQPSAEHIAEAASYVRSLATHGQIGGRAGQHTLQPTHVIETDEQGNKKLVRKRFTAF